MLGPILKDVRSNGDGVSIIKIDVDKTNKSLLSTMRGVPTMILFQTENNCGDNLAFWIKGDHQTILEKSNK
jgi:hypothetical protein